jgi:transcriptional regulator with XRE-family HTH domain
MTGVAGDQGQGPIVQSALLRGELVRLRKDRGMTQEQVASALEWSPSKLIRVEGGRSAITKVDLDALLTQYGVTSQEQRQRLADLNRTARDRGWWDAYRNYDFDPTFLTYVGYEAGASLIRALQGLAVPGLLQTREYAEVLAENSLDAVMVRPAVDLRMQRQAELARRSAPPHQFHILDEAVIRRHVGIRKDPAIMPNQLRYIADRAERDELLTIRVIPFSVGAHAGISGPFTLLEFDGGLADILYLDAGARAISMVVGDDARIAEYADNFLGLIEESLPEDQSIEYLRSAADQMLLFTCGIPSLKDISRLLSDKFQHASV